MTASCHRGVLQDATAALPATRASANRSWAVLWEPLTDICPGLARTRHHDRERHDEQLTAEPHPGAQTAASSTAFITRNAPIAASRCGTGKVQGIADLLLNTAGVGISHSSVSNWITNTPYRCPRFDLAHLGPTPTAAIVGHRTVSSMVAAGISSLLCDRWHHRRTESLGSFGAATPTLPLSHEPAFSFEQWPEIIQVACSIRPPTARDAKGGATRRCIRLGNAVCAATVSTGLTTI